MGNGSIRIMGNRNHDIVKENDTKLFNEHSVLIPQSSALITQSSVLSTQHFLELSTELLQRGLCIRFQANGCSMRPTIADGEIITVAPVAPSDVKVGDIILYHKGRKPIAHRVVKIANRGSEAVITRSTHSSLLSPHHSVLSPAQSSALSPQPLFILRGDAHGMCDEPVEPYQIVGRVVSVERGGRQIALDSRRAKIVLPIRLFTFRLKRWIVKNCLAGIRKNKGLSNED
jgi:hypothetical protein